MFIRATRITAEEVPKAKADKNQKGKESEDNSAKSKLAVKANEKLKTSTPLNNPIEKIMASRGKTVSLSHRR